MTKGRKPALTFSVYYCSGGASKFNTTNIEIRGFGIGKEEATPLLCSASMLSI